MTAFARQHLLFAALMTAITAASVPSKAAPEAKASATSRAPLPAVGERIVNHRMSGIALDGFDPVGYFERLRPVPGKPGFELHVAGTTWRFATEANLLAFKATPEAYMPAFGGYDAVAVAHAKPVAGMPQYFSIDTGRLVVFASAEARERFAATPELMEAAIRNWPTVERQLAR